MNDLVEASGLSKGAFYHYFKSKEELYLEAMNKYFFSYMESFELNYDSDITFSQNLGKIGELTIVMLREMNTLLEPKDAYVSYYLTVLEGVKRSPSIKATVTKYYREYVNRIGEWIRIGQNNGEISVHHDPMLLSNHFNSMLEGFFMINTLDNSLEQIEQKLHAVIKQFCELIK